MAPGLGLAARALRWGRMALVLAGAEAKAQPGTTDELQDWCRAEAEPLKSGACDGDIVGIAETMGVVAVLATDDAGYERDARHFL